jgi:hypothetical protein
MVYVAFVSDKPVIADDGDVVITNTRENLMALRDAVVAGALVDWDMSQTVGGGDTDEPDEILYSNNGNTEALKLDITWGTAGGEDGNPTVIVYHYSTDDFSGSDETIGTWTGTYNSNGTLTVGTWS